MEKYYIAKLLNWPEGDRQQRSKLVEIQFSRRPPTFGILYLVSSDAPGQGQQDQASSSQSIYLATLSLASDNKAGFGVLKQIHSQDLIEQQRSSTGTRIGDFDIGNTVLIEGSSSNEQQLLQSACIILTQDGNLFLVSLIDCGVKWLLTCGRGHNDTKKDRKFIQCRMQIRSNDQNDFFVHALAEKCYYLYLVQVSTKQHHPSTLLSEYHLTQDEARALRFTGLHLMSSANPQSAVMLKLSDGSIRIVKRSKCLHSDQFGAFDSFKNEHDNQHYSILSSLAADQPTIILTYSGYQITAHSLLIDDQLDSDDQHQTETTLDDAGQLSVEQQIERQDHDPDQLLPREPSFELEKCWSIDLNDIDSIRSLDDVGERTDLSTSSTGCLCPIWSSNQLNETSWPKFLFVANKHHVLLYSFEQQTVLPFSVVYDRAFMHPIDDSAIQQQQQNARPAKDTSPFQQESIDLRMRPKLLHNFKLIGTQTNDSLFNTLFLVSKVRLVQARQYSQLGLLACISNLGDLLAFKLTSPELVRQKDNLYQQLLLDSIREGSLLKDEINRIQLNNTSLRNDISSLENRSTSAPAHNQDKHLFENLDMMLKTDLTHDELVGGLYNLTISWSNLIQVTKVVVVSTVQSHILDTNQLSSNPVIKSIKIDNCGDTHLNEDEVLLLNGVDDMTNLIGESIGSTLKPQSSQKFRSKSPLVQAFATVELHEKPKNFRISLAIFLVDGQFGQVGVYFTLNSPAQQKRIESIGTSLVTGELSSEINCSQSVEKFYKKTIAIKPLLSYKLAMLGQSDDQLAPSQSKKRLEIHCSSGQEQARMLLRWLNECLQQVVCMDTKPNNQLTLESTFTHCSLKCNKSNQDKLIISSDDFIALELIKNHLLKRATDQSIQLEVSYSSPSMSELRHLIGKQKINSDQAMRVLNQVNANDTLENEEDFLLENLLGEVNPNLVPVEFGSLNLLEKSFKRDIEKLITSRDAKFYTSTPKYTERHQHIDQKPFMMRQLAAGYIINALVDYDHLHNIKTPEESVASMRPRLIKIMEESQLDAKSFVDRVLEEWMQCNKIV